MKNESLAQDCFSFYLLPFLDDTEKFLQANSSITIICNQQLNFLCDLNESVILFTNKDHLPTLKEFTMKFLEGKSVRKLTSDVIFRLFDILDVFKDLDITKLFFDKIMHDYYNAKTDTVSLKINEKIAEYVAFFGWNALKESLKPISISKISNNCILVQVRNF